MQNSFPRWRGFNLTELVRFAGGNLPDEQARITEDDLRWIADWGFDFIRIPVDYRNLLTPGSERTFHEATGERIDQLLALTDRHHLHLS
ncbi:MAG TPA: hypothetical protein VKB76_12870, partial [Ktedonobacterales bacterium]|nr:hypothetical protein [Ktedonobacterales bacterium]